MAIKHTKAQDEEDALRKQAEWRGERPAEGEGLPSASVSRDSYSRILQGKPIHGLLSSSAAHGAIEIDSITHTGTINSDGVLITLDEADIQGVSPQTFKVLIILLAELTSQMPRDNTSAEAINRARTVHVSLSAYMEACKLKNVKEARSQLNAAIKAIYAISLEWDEVTYEKPEGKNRKIKIKKHHRARITDHTITEEDGSLIKRGVAEFRFSFDLAEYLNSAYLMPFHPALLGINTHLHPYSLQLGWRLCALCNMNYGKPTQHITSVQTLLRACKGIPRYSDQAQKGQIYNKIVRPFDRDLSALVDEGVLSTYWYLDDSDARIDSKDLWGLTYAQFVKLRIYYELKDYPQAPRLTAKNARVKPTVSHNKETGDQD